jgi:hypothetical protein
MSRHWLAKTQVDAVFSPELRGAKPEAIFLHLAQEIGLGQRRALVGGGRFVAQHHDLALRGRGLRSFAARAAPACPAPTITTRITYPPSGMFRHATL